MATYLEIQEQIKALQAQAEAQKAEELPSVIADIKSKVAQYGITADQIFDQAVVSLHMDKHESAGRKEKLPMKYEFKGEQWSGRGKMPKAMQAAIDEGKAKSKADFLIQQ